MPRAPQAGGRVAPRPERESARPPPATRLPPPRLPASPAAAASRPARSPPPPRRPGVREASPRRRALPTVGRTARPPAPCLARDPPVCLPRSRLPTSAGGCHSPALSLPLPWTFHLGFFHSVLLPFNSFLPNWPPLAFLPVDSWGLATVEKPETNCAQVGIQEFEGRPRLLSSLWGGFALFCFVSSLHLRNPEV